ncbi:MAG: hypothetical protein C5B55_01000 [Blastocatellia bacterium]|nr:MAG: hypothetical protein C5B55_01000 [Blastocatellia bacterium]
MTSIFQDIRYGVRILLKQPGFTLVAVITLALGIGVNTAIFSVVNGVLLRPLPFREADRLALLWHRGAEAAGGDRTPLSYADLLDMRAQNRSFEGIAAYQWTQLNNSGGDAPIQLAGVNVTSNFLTVLGVNVQLGRDFQPNDEQVRAPQAVILSDGFWRSRFGADQRVIGHTLKLNGVNANIIGVMPPSFDFPRPEVQVWSALQLEQPTRRGPYFLTGVARLKRGVTTSQAQLDSRQMISSFEKSNFNLNVFAVNDFIVGEIRPALIALFVSVTLVLLIASVNVANLTLVRAASRLKEIMIRSALGASRARIVRRLLTESLLVTLAGGLVGILCASWGASFLVKLAPPNLPRIDQIKIDGTVLGWTTLISLLSAIVFGLVPAWQSSRLNLNDMLRDAGKNTGENQRRRRSRNILVVAELGLAVMLLAGAGLLVKSLWRLGQVNLGINPNRVLTMSYTLTGDKYNDGAALRDFGRSFVEGVQSLPGVNAVAISSSLPPDQTDYSDVFYIEGKPIPTQPNIAYFSSVSPEYFRALEIPVRRGRVLTEDDRENEPLVCLVNETFQRTFFGSEDFLRKRINIDAPGKPKWVEIVGVVADVKYNGLTESVQPIIYLPVAQSPLSAGFLVVKTTPEDATSLIGPIRNELKKVDPDLPVTNVGSMADQVSNRLAEPRFRTGLITLFAVVALLLACVGVYGVISYSVSQRTHEIGIRMALGARAADVQRMIVKQAIYMSVLGVIVGLTISFFVVSLMVKLLFNVTPRDPIIFGAAAVVLATTAFVASYIPAHRASKLDPLVALKSE